MLFDTNILIDFLHGLPLARQELGRYDDKAISVTTWMDVMVGATPPAAAGSRAFPDGFLLVGLNAALAERAAMLRRLHRLKVPDAIVSASAQVQAMLVVARDIKGFPGYDPSVPNPYRV